MNIAEIQNFRIVGGILSCDEGIFLSEIYTGYENWPPACWIDINNIHNSKSKPMLEMDFEITVDYNGEEIVFRADYIGLGYSYKINVDVYGQLVSFEPDKDRNFRAVLYHQNEFDPNGIDLRLVEAIGKEIMRLFRKNQDI